MAAFYWLDGLPFTTVILRANGKTLTLNRVLIDTGSGGCLFKTDDLSQLDIFPAPDDVIVGVSGIGGNETVIDKLVDELAVGELKVTHFTVEMSAMDYDFEMDGILGVDFLRATRAMVDFAALEIRPPQAG
jgi:hypothetical protein